MSIDQIMDNSRLGEHSDRESSLSKTRLSIDSSRGNYLKFYHYCVNYTNEITYRTIFNTIW